MNDPSQWKRRGFLGSLLVAGGAAMGWMVRRSQNPERIHAHRDRPLDESFVYDVSEFEKTDPSLLKYQPAGSFDTTMDPVQRVEVMPVSQEILVAGGTSIGVFSNDGALIRKLSIPRPVHALLATDENEFFVGQRNHYLILDAEGKERGRSPDLGRKTYITSLAVHGDRVFAADAGNREVVVCDRVSGAMVDRFGKKDPERSNPGFNVPSPYFDLAVTPDGQLQVVNPGLLRMETYTLDGYFIDAWGEPGMQIERFCGCCNPVYFTQLPGGDLVTSEKGLARIKVYSAEGEFKGVVTGPDQLVDDKELAKKACNDCSIGAGFDVAVTDDGHLLALDPFRKTVRRYTPLETDNLAAR